jgi:cytochrome c-type biogenesis protein CcmH/NrfF
MMGCNLEGLPSAQGTFLALHPRLHSLVLLLLLLPLLPPLVGVLPLRQRWQRAEEEWPRES